MRTFVGTIGLAIVLSGCQTAMEAMVDPSAAGQRLGTDMARSIRRSSTDVSEFKPISFRDLTLDAKNMRNMEVAVQVRATVHGDLAILRDPNSKSASTITAKIDGLSREERGWLVDNCAESCNTEVLGVVQVSPGRNAVGLDVYHLRSFLPS